MPDPAPDPTTEPQPNSTTPSTSDPQGSVQDRINQLTRRASDAERAASATAAANAALTSKLTAIEDQLAQLGRAPQDPPTASAASGQPGKQESLSRDDMKAMIQDSLNEALLPVQQQSQEIAMQALHQERFNAVVQRYPELGQEDSTLRKTFNDFWNNRREFAQMQDGVDLVAEISRGVLRDTLPAEQARKLAATTNQPSTGRTYETAPKDVKEAKDALSALVDQGKTKDIGAQGLEDYLRLKVGTANTE